MIKTPAKAPDTQQGHLDGSAALTFGWPSYQLVVTSLHRGDGLEVRRDDACHRIPHRSASPGASSVKLEQEGRQEIKVVPGLRLIDGDDVDLSRQGRPH